MGKKVYDTVMDAALDYVAACTRMDVVSGAGTPTDLSTSLADVTMTAGAGGVDYTIAEGDDGPGSLKLTITAQEGEEVEVTGDPTHVVLSLSGTLRLITTCTGPELTDGSTVDFPAWKYEIGVAT